MVYNADLNEGFFNSLRYLNKYYGITQNPNTEDFIIIMKYYKSGSLKDYVTKNFYNIKWIEKLKILKRIVAGLKHLHDQKIIHRDFHSGNILYENDFDLVISDLGISKSSIDKDDEEIYGVISYIAPEILQQKEYTIASDIYSFGMIMWELMTGRKPFWDQKNDIELIVKICENIRPPIIINAPKGYIELMQECWDSDPNKRPTTIDILIRLINIKRVDDENPTEIIKSSNIGPILIKNSDKSRLLSKIIKFAKSIRSSENNSITSTYGK